MQVCDSTRFTAPVAKLNDLLSSSEFLSDLSYITGIPELLADEQLVGGGVHMTGPGGRLDVHVDFNFIEDRKLYRRLNLLLYLNESWQSSSGAVIFETNEISFHGVVPVSPSAPAPRPHWPQPGLIPRSASRGTLIEIVGYMGHRSNLWTGFLESKFENELQKLGVTLQINDSEAAYHDYRKCDIVIAVRVTERDYLAKPASKLVNAWHAGVPALLGPEPGFQILRKTELDYIEISSTEQAIRALRRLKNNPALYMQMIENGRHRARDFTKDTIAARWHEVLSGPVAKGFFAWSNKSVAWKSLVRPTLFVWKAAQNIRERREYVYYRDHGYRPISGRTT